MQGIQRKEITNEYVLYKYRDAERTLNIDGECPK
jgi:hypothetical protein